MNTRINVTKKLRKESGSKMGLATSQARFLAITSRKASCEFRSMRIAQDKLSITRQLATATQDYQNSLNKTKLVWDMNGTSGTTANDGQTYDLSYDVMMSPSALNGYDPYLITDRTGQVILNSRMAAAARKAGVDPDGKTKPNVIGYQNFVQQLGVQGYIATSQVSTLKSDNKYYNSQAGIGGEPLDKTQASAMTLSNMINYISKRSEDDEDFKKLATINLPDSTIFSNSSNYTDKTINLTDLLTKNITYIGADKSLDEAKGQVTPIVEAIMEAMQSMFAKDSVSNEALVYAKSEMLKMLDPSVGSRPYNVGKGTIFNSISITSSIANGSEEYNTWVKASNFGKEGYGISLSNMLKSFLTLYAQAVGNYDNNYKITDRKSESSYVTSDPNYFYVLERKEAVTEKDLLVADFYSSMYNNICTKGWSTAGGDIDDKEYLAHAIKNGQLFITSMHDDYTYYQDPYTFNGHVMEVTDTEAITRAETEYTKAKSVLNYKEERLELDMKNIDTELSALTTEYDSVKNLISKNIEKVFTMFST